MYDITIYAFIIFIDANTPNMYNFLIIYIYIIIIIRPKLIIHIAIAEHINAAFIRTYCT